MFIPTFVSYGSWCLSCDNSGIQVWNPEEYARALEYFQLVVEQNPDDRLAKLYVGRFHTRMGLTPQHSHYLLVIGYKKKLQLAMGTP